MKILTVIGARPQFIKASTFSRYIASLEDSFVQEIIIHTGQHYDSNMSAVFFDQMGIPKPKYVLNTGGLGHGKMTGQIMFELETIVINENPDWMLVYGDTNSTLAGALVAVKLNVKLAHVEAGLRSFNMRMPEEINRILTDRVSNLLFCPTQNAVDNLTREGYNNFDDIKILEAGDIMKEGINLYKDYASEPLHYINRNNDFILCTIHRAENTDDQEKLSEIIEALNLLSESYEIILPVHPRTKNRIQNLEIKVKFTLIDPVSYFEMLWLISNSILVLTDSGGLQKEAYFLEKYCVTLREETEWLELVEYGYNLLVGSSKEKIISAVQYFINLDFNDSHDFYGSGSVSELILDEMKKFEIRIVD